MTESFEDVCASYDDCTWIGRNGVEAAISRLQKAHDHEMEQLRRSRFREGYEAGQRSMDAEHQAVASKVMQVPYDDDAMEFLFHISAIICGGYYTSNKLLRDELVRLLGGVHDGPAQTVASGGACDADCDCHNQQSQAIAYDELDNERHKAVCRLREFVPMIGHKPTEEASKLIRCITGNDDSHVACGNDLEETRDRLIHLLGGDEPLPNPFRIPAEPDGGENCRITDELRKFATDPLLGYASQELHVERITAIADRIDEQFKRICWQQEAVLQSTIDTMVDERDEMQRERDEWRRGAEHEADKRKEYKGLFERYKDSYVEYVGRYNIAVKEREELRKSLRMIAERIGVPHHRSLSMYGDEELKEATLDAIDSKNKHIGALKWQRDRQRKLLDEYENADTPEDIVRDIHLGKVTDSQAVERIRALR